MNHWHQRNDSVVNASKWPLEKTHRVGGTPYLLWEIGVATDSL